MSSRPDPWLGPEFSRPLPLEALGDDELVQEIEATEGEREALARRLALVSLERLAAVLRVRRPGGGNLVTLTGRFEADVTQSCVVSLAPLQRHLAEDFSVQYSLMPDDADEAATLEVDPEADDPPEALGPGGPDLGEAVVQQLAVALEPYPRGEDASLGDLGWSGEDREEAAETSPFRQLRALSDKR